jgi:hypothetical protein
MQIGLIWAKTFDSITKYDLILIHFDSPGVDVLRSYLENFLLRSAPLQSLVLPISAPPRGVKILFTLGDGFIQKIVKARLFRVIQCPGYQPASAFIYPRGCISKWVGNWWEKIISRVSWMKFGAIFSGRAKKIAGFLRETPSQSRLRDQTAYPRRPTANNQKHHPIPREIKTFAPSGWSDRASEPNQVVDKPFHFPW